MAATIYFRIPSIKTGHANKNVFQAMINEKINYCISEPEIAPNKISGQFLHCYKNVNML